MGDVAMTVPVIQQVLQQYPSLEITVVSATFLQPLFNDIERCHFIGVQLKKEHKGVLGLYRLFRYLNKQSFTAIADLHNVLRSKILTALFRFTGQKIATINKGRTVKKALVRKQSKIKIQLETTHQRYANVFAELGYPVNVDVHKPVLPKPILEEKLVSLFSENEKHIGIAPFAQHSEKMYPLQKMKEVVVALAQQKNTLLFFFGGGEHEKKVLTGWSKEIANSVCIAGNYSLHQELSIISKLDLMISMDSANMHLASLYNIPVVSIWGATHVFAGFYGWGQDTQNVVDVDLPCRPCSVFGNKPCYRGDHACMQQITTEQIISKVNNNLYTN